MSACIGRTSFGFVASLLIVQAFLHCQLIAAKRMDNTLGTIVVISMKDCALIDFFHYVKAKIITVLVKLKDEHFQDFHNLHALYEFKYALSMSF